ncbi:RodZ family helix-turn-helix domain-containing protein [Micromonospora carbonacea]|uniref:hypothetical protein n=1 Tax=Micromonospora carbonacea TaxID=47853 RepID=UPI00371FB956
MIENAVARIPEPEPFIAPTTATPASGNVLGHATSAITNWATNPDNTMTAVAITLGVLLAVKVLRRRRKPTTSQPADDLTATDRAITRISAGIATIVVALGMWQFFTDVINVHWTLRLVLFGFIELGIVDAARRATRHLYRHGDLGKAHRAVFFLAGTSATLSAVHADSIDLRLFRVAAAVVASYMWFESLREQRDILHHRNPGKYPPITSRGIPWKRIGATLGLVEATTLEVTEVATQRRIDRLSRLLNHFHAVTAGTDPGRVKQWYISWLTRRVVRKTQAACKYINLAENPEVRKMLLRRLNVVRGIVEATKPDATRHGDAWADVTQIATGDADRHRHVIDVDVTTDAPTPTVTRAADGDAQTVTPPQTPTVTRQSPTPVTPHTVTIDGDATPATVTSDATADAPTITVTAADATPAAVTRRPVTVRRTSTDVAVVRPLSRDLLDERVRDWTVEQIRDYAAGKARQIVAGGGTKREGMRVFLLLCMALGVDPAGTWMAEAVEGAQSAARTNKPEWLAELAVADAEQILLAEHQRIVAELADGGDVRA